MGHAQRPIREGDAGDIAVRGRGSGLAKYSPYKYSCDDTLWPLKLAEGTLWDWLGLNLALESDSTAGTPYSVQNLLLPPTVLRSS